METMHFIPCQRIIKGQFVTLQKYAQAGSNGDGWILTVGELDVEVLM